MAAPRLLIVLLGSSSLCLRTFALGHGQQVVSGDRDAGYTVGVYKCSYGSRRVD